MKGAEARSQIPILAFDVMNNTATGPGQEGRNNQAHALARTRRRKTKNMFRSVMAKVVATESAEHDPVRPHQLCGPDFGCRSPTRRPIGRGRLGLARSPD